ncbi:alkaline phosphatase family protein [Conexibacter woesei]|uniref:Phosphoesterase n=1 Tax=Conexibacter woesei (strain DSM 14684 / CCUG 47730 / CIP 108061 / JCM 11494 / NBRC 100937 / ID131577) TaxID=469383 RepID=D3FE70_CONWI|nr:alkaline phosphatase family protein [Conexibacter woesei]ADB53562.1 phosphoesterase [Conexibacter woesei DSM 14684]
MTPQVARRRRAALPVALAALVGLAIVTSTNVPASPAGSSQPPLTVVLPAPVAQAPPAAEPAEPPVEDAEPAAAELPEATPVADPPVADPPATDPPAADDDESAPDETAGEETPPAQDPDPAPPVEHVFLIALGGADVNALAGDETAAPYLAGTLAKSGTLLSDYRTIARGGLANRIALISGQGPTTQTLSDCTTYADVEPADALADGQAGGDGCVYGVGTGHLGDQLRALKRTWKAYVEPAAADAAATCDAGADTTRRNPFLWFRGTVEADDCDARNVPLAQLEKDLRDAETTPALSWIASDAQQGSADADRFLERVVPQIQSSLAYAGGGLIAIVGDQPPSPAPPPETPTPSTLAPTTYANVGDAVAAGAGVPVGALLISASTPSGKVDATPANAFTLLRTLQWIYGVDPLGYAAADGVAPLSDDLALSAALLPRE